MIISTINISIYFYFNALLYFHQATLIYYFGFRNFFILN